MPRTQTEAPDVIETVLDQFAGPARRMSQGEVDVITKRFKKGPGRSDARNGTSGRLS